MPAANGTTVQNGKEFQIDNFLGHQQYDDKGVRRYEFMYGETFISPGGASTNREFLKKMGLKAGDRVLDVACGMGGACFQFAKEFGAFAHGFDLSSSMIAAGKQYLANMSDDIKEKVTFEVGDVITQNLPEGYFDFIYSRDALMHVHDKKTMYDNFFKWLKPGGKILMTDYCSGERKDKTGDFMKYLKERSYVMLTLPEYTDILKKAGFTDVSCTDISQLFIDLLKMEISRILEKKEEFLKHFSESDLEFLLKDWRAKIQNSETKDQCWGLICATKPIM